MAFLEGPAVDRRGAVYFSNIPAEQILKFEPGRRTWTVFRDKNNQANGLRFDRQGRLVACEGAGRVTRIDLASKEVTVLAQGFDGKPLGAPNDVEIDARGRIYFTSRVLGREKDGNVNAVDRIDPDGTLSRILAAPDINRPDGTVTNERLLYDFYPGRSGDGVRVDAEGNLYVAADLHRRRGGSETLDTRPGIHVTSPQGKLRAFLEMTEDTITNCAFGGPDLRTLYVTCGKLLLSVRTRIPGKASY